MLGHFRPVCVNRIGMIEMLTDEQKKRLRRV